MIYSSMIKIIDNFAPAALQADILAALSDRDNFQWNYTDVVSGDAPNEYNNLLYYGFSHNAYLSQPVVEQSKFFKVFLPLIYFIEERTGVTVNQLIRIRAGMQTIVDANKNIVHPPHVDYKTPHKTLVYYANESDGETLFYKEKYTGEKIEDFHVDQVVKPKMGSAVLFDGLTYHSSSSPTISNTRLAITVNFL